MFGVKSAATFSANLRGKPPAPIGKSAMNKTEKIVLDRFKALLSERIGLHRLILFGSRARGDADPVGPDTIREDRRQHYACDDTRDDEATD